MLTLQDPNLQALIGSGTMAEVVDDCGCGSFGAVNRGVQWRASIVDLHRLSERKAEVSRSTVSRAGQRRGIQSKTSQHRPDFGH
ncbi:hypothetical protein J6590_005586 [Homalodisca vitripennis]|nr:hypothetical protein J6590_005586 [Homalodisca vitripennis]